LGKGTFGKVYKCEYTDGNGNIYLAACKKCNPEPEAETEDVFSREIKTLRKLNHLFVVKYLDAVEKDSKKY
jgi:serine/threonine protein kinase